MSRRSALREELYAAILDDADVACHYWWYEHRESGDEPMLPPFNSLTTDHVARGWRRLLKVEKAGRFHCCGDDHAARNAEAAVRAGIGVLEGEGSYDGCACVADAVIQCALLGEIVYG